MESDSDRAAPETDEVAPLSRAERRAQRLAERRRRRAPPLIDTSVPSPCIAVCEIDQAAGHCIGCYRSLEEIRDWPILDRPAKLSVLEACARRKASDPATS